MLASKLYALFLVVLLGLATLAAIAQSFRVQCPASAITHRVAAHNNSESAQRSNDIDQRRKKDIYRTRRMCRAPPRASKSWVATVSRRWAAATKPTRSPSDRCRGRGHG
jgi:hypothetical protein